MLAVLESLSAKPQNIATEITSNTTADILQQPMQPAMAAPSPAYQRVMPQAAMKAPTPTQVSKPLCSSPYENATPTDFWVPQATAQLSQVVGSVKSERSDARRSSFQMGALMM